MGSPIKVVVAHDDGKILKFLSRLLGQHFQVLASISRGDRLVPLALSLRPDVIVCNIEMPGHDGLEAMLRLRASGVEIPFVLLGTATIGIAELLQAGAAAYIHKGDAQADLVGAVVLATTGARFISRSIDEV